MPFATILSLTRRFSQTKRELVTIVSLQSTLNQLRKSLKDQAKRARIERIQHLSVEAKVLFLLLIKRVQAVNFSYKRRLKSIRCTVSA